MTPTVRRFVFLLVLFVAAVPSGASAAPPAQSAPSADNDKIAKLHYQAGAELYRTGRYRAALAEFRKGFGLVGKSAFLINIAQCQRKLGELEAARENIHTFLESDPDSPMLPEARAVLEDIEQALKTQGENAPAPAAQPLPSATPAPAASPTPAVIVAPTPPKKSTPVYKKWWLWTTVAVVAVGAGLGLGLGFGLRSTATEFSAQVMPAVPQ